MAQTDHAAAVRRALEPVDPGERRLATEPAERPDPMAPVVKALTALKGALNEAGKELHWWPGGASPEAMEQLAQAAQSVGVAHAHVSSAAAAHAAHEFGRVQR